MPKGKLQSPFFGRYEMVDAASPILYSRWAASTAEEQPDAHDLPDGQTSSPRKRKREQPEDTGAGSEQTANDKKSKQKSKDGQSKKQKDKAGKVILSSGPGNATEALEMRGKLGYSAPHPSTTAASGAFGFGFQLQESTADQTVADAADLVAPGVVAIEQNGSETQPKAKRKKHKKSKQLENGTQEAEPAAEPPAAVVPEPAQPVPRRVFVGGMPFSMEEEDIREYWSECGPVESLDLMRFPDTGRFKGIAFITFAEEEGCQAALQCQGEELQGQVLRVEPCLSVPAKASTKARKAKQPAAAPTPSSAASAPKTPGYHVAYVGNIPFMVTAQQLKAFFQNCSVTKVRLHTDRNSGKFKGFAHVHFADEASVDRAVKLEGQELEGRQLKIGYAQPKKQ